MGRLAFAFRVRGFFFFWGGEMIEQWGIPPFPLFPSSAAAADRFVTLTWGGGEKEQRWFGSWRNKYPKRRKFWLLQVWKYRSEFETRKYRKVGLYKTFFCLCHMMYRTEVHSTYKLWGGAAAKSRDSGKCMHIREKRRRRRRRRRFFSHRRLSLPRPLLHIY